MQKLWIVSDTPSKAAAIRRQLDGIFDLRFLDLNRIRDTEPPQNVLFDVDCTHSGRVVKVKEWLRHKAKDSKIIFAIDKASHLQVIQARALGAMGILYRPFERKELIKTLLGDLESLSNDNPNDPIKTSPGVGKAFDALRNIFASAAFGTPLDSAAINWAGEAVIRRMDAHGLGSWVATVRKHHSQTYQHCLIVTGVTVAFAQHLGLSRRDQLRLSFGAMLHDIGKARIPVAVLEKPSALTTDEMALLAKHPEYGFEAIKTMPGLNKELLDIVLHHHEYLDGSGYPHRLCGSEISDPVRIVTICDIFGALLERRAYKQPLAADVAYQVLLDMGNKLDRDLVREFGFTKAIRFNTEA
jgi:putative nucleotidyltransferase with HDIG domain